VKNETQSKALIDTVNRAVKILLIDCKEYNYSLVGTLTVICTSKLQL